MESRSVPIKMGGFPVLLALCILLAAGCGRRSQEAEDPLSDGMLTVGVINGNDRFCYLENGAYKGIEPDLARRMAGLDLEGQKLQVSFKEAPDRQTLLSMLDDRDIDCAMGRISEDDEIASKYYTTRYYGKGSLFLLTLKNCYIDNLGGLNGSMVGISSSVPAGLVGDIPFVSEISQEQFESADRMADAILDGSIFAGICEERDALRLVSEREGLQAQEILNSPKENYVVVLRQDSREFYDRMSGNVTGYLDEMALQGGYVDYGAMSEGGTRVERFGAIPASEEEEEGQEDMENAAGAAEGSFTGDSSAGYAESAAE